MKQLFRSVAFLLFVGGWALASSAVYVVRTPTKVLLFPKNQLGYTDTYADTRTWTLTEDRAHAALVARVVQLGRSDALAHTVNANLGPAALQLAAAAATPTVTTGPDLADKAKIDFKNIGDGIKAKLN